MQEEVDSRTVALTISAAKFTGWLFKAAIGKYMAHRKVKTDGNQNGRQTEVRHIFQSKGRGRTDSSLHGILKKDRGEREKAVGSQKTQGFVSRSQRQGS